VNPSMAQPPDSASRNSRRSRSLRALGLASIAATVVAVTVLAVRRYASTPDLPSWDLVVRPTALDQHRFMDGESSDCSVPPSKILIVAWDGAEWAHILPLLEQGRMPHLAALMERGVSGNMYGFRPSLSPALWTSVATGVSPERHGIHGFEKSTQPSLWTDIRRLFQGSSHRLELASNADRRARALWNLLDAPGRSSFVIGWHNTYPVEPITGVMVSNWLVQAHTAKHTNWPQRPVWQLPSSFAAGLVYPFDEAERVLRIAKDVECSLDQEIGRFARFTPQELERFALESQEPGTWSYFLRQAYLYDTIHARAAAELLSESQPTATLVHFQALDLISHRLLWFHRPEDFDDTTWSEAERSMLAQEAPRWRNTLTAFHEYLDEWLGQLQEKTDAGTAVLVLSDHGFEPKDDALNSGQHESAPPGIFVLAGPGLRRGTRVDASLYDVLPTVLAMLGLPVARDLEHRPLEEVFCPEARREIQWVDTFVGEGPFAPSIALPEELRRELEARLRSLGYSH
jgi:predicted AlkP superfamily phosphohydrolase/phosphomutase